tara:strand:- start:170 stop:802 length:633 start_codon:yes stop_codon:yes gene_type:complete
LEVGFAALISSGFVFGAGNAIAPGPLSVIILSQTLRRGFWSGFVCALAPLVSDIFIIGLSLTLLAGLPEGSLLFDGLHILGGLFILHLAWGMWKGSTQPKEQKQAARPFLQAVFVNLLNPYPYMFWITIGSRYIAAEGALQKDGAFFLSSFYLSFLAVKVVMMGLVLGGGRLLGSKGHNLANKGFAVLLLGFGLWFLWDVLADLLPEGFL